MCATVYAPTVVRLNRTGCPTFTKLGMDIIPYKVTGTPYLRLLIVSNDSVGGARHCEAGETQLPLRALKLCMGNVYFICRSVRWPSNYAW